jgi:hypothetical protein
LREREKRGKEKKGKKNANKKTVSQNQAQISKLALLLNTQRLMMKEKCAKSKKGSIGEKKGNRATRASA